uniref:X1R n=1 Tax=Squirrelpox virus TaxID=240426 RepID=Q1HTP6_9POXV|nr:X1R [Squirrelpox virus]
MAVAALIWLLACLLGPSAAAASGVEVRIYTSGVHDEHVSYLCVGVCPPGLTCSVYWDFLSDSSFDEDFSYRYRMDLYDMGTTETHDGGHLIKKGLELSDANSPEMRNLTLVCVLTSSDGQKMAKVTRIGDLLHYPTLGSTSTVSLAELSEAVEANLGSSGLSGSHRVDPPDKPEDGRTDGRGDGETGGLRESGTSTDGDNDSGPGGRADGEGTNGDAEGEYGNGGQRGQKGEGDGDSDDEDEEDEEDEDEDEDDDDDYDDYDEDGEYEYEDWRRRRRFDRL